MTEKLLKTEQVAEILGYTKQGIYQLVFKKKIPAFHLSGRALRFRESDINQWLKSKFVPADGTIPEVKTKGKRGRPRKSKIANDFVDNIVETAKREIKGGEL